MKKLFTLSLFSVFFFSDAHAQGEWTWIHGDTVTNSTGSFGIIGFADPANNPPSMYEAINWDDGKGNIWVYGGYNTLGLYSAVWKYNVYTNLWTWVQGDTTVNIVANYGTQGVATPTNTPGGRNCALTWIDSSGNFWMYGGYKPGNLVCTDLWKLDTTSLEWTWMSGVTGTGLPGTLAFGIPSVTNHPQSTSETHAGWIDNQNQLWYYGGIRSSASSYYNNVYRYNISTNEWTWVAGSGAANQLPTFGTLGVSSATNTPGSRTVYGRWKDSAGNFWFINGGTVNGCLNDLWMFSTTTNEWTWMGGPQTVNNLGNYSARCDWQGNNYPASRGEDEAVYLDKNNKVWMFGGTTTPANDELQDLWLLDYTTMQYNWMHGSNLLNQSGFYGQLNVPSPSNIPPSRDGAVLFGDSLCHIFLFGGIYRTGGARFYNDVWKFTPDSSCGGCAIPVPPVAALSVNDSVICPGTCISFSNLSQSAISYQWIFNGANPSTSTDINPQNICYDSTGSFDVALIASNGTSHDTLILFNYVTVYPQPTVPAIVQSGDTLYAPQGYASYQWFFGSDTISGANNYYYVAMQSGNYNLVVTDENGCSVGAGIVNVIASSPTPALPEGEGVSVFPSPARGEFTVYGFQFSVCTIEIYNSLGDKIYLTNVSNSNQKIISSKQFSSGIYLLKITDGKKIMTKKIVIEK